VVVLRNHQKDGDSDRRNKTIILIAALPGYAWDLVDGHAGTK
jgi:hypothetical protein